MMTETMKEIIKIANEMAIEVDYDEYDFCPNCGQAIDWSEKE